MYFMIYICFALSPYVSILLLNCGVELTTFCWLQHGIEKNVHEHVIDEFGCWKWDFMFSRR
jgi:hypothetical protein